MKIKLQKLTRVIKKAVCSKAPGPFTTGLCSSGISSIKKLPLQPVTNNKTFSTGQLLPDSSLTPIAQTCLFILSIIFGWIILLISLSKTAYKITRPNTKATYLGNTIVIFDPVDYKIKLSFIKLLSSSPTTNLTGPPIHNVDATFASGTDIS